MLELEEIEAFWGESAVALGFPGVDFSARPRLEIGIWAAEDDAAGDLLDQFRPVAGLHFRYLQLPQGTNQLRLSFSEGASPSWMTLDLHANETVSARDHVHNLAFIQMGALGEPLDLQFERLSPINDPEHFVDRLAAQGRLVWAAVQRRNYDWERKRIAISATELLWPRRKSRLVIEAARQGPVPNATTPPTDAQHPTRPPAYAVLEKAQAEEARRVAPCLRIRQLAGNRYANRSHGRVFVFYLMQQRRFFQTIAARDAERPLETLTSEDILTAFAQVSGDPMAVQQRLPLVQDHAMGPFAFDLASAFEALDRGEAYHVQGAIVRRVGARDVSDPAIEIEFRTATLGDEVGIFVGPTSATSLSVSPRDPAGSPRVRIFRLGKTGLTPRPVMEEEQILSDLTQWATPLGTPQTRARGATDPVVAERNRAAVELLQSRIGDPALVDGVDLAAAFASPLEPFALLSFADMVATSPRDRQRLINQVGGLAVFLRDSAAVSTLVVAPHLAGPEMVEALTDPDLPLVDPALPRRLAAGLGAADLVPATLASTEQLQAIRILCEQDLSQRLIELRVALGIAKSGMQKAAARVVTVLGREETVRDAADSYHDRGMTSQAQDLMDYLNNRDLGDWIPLQEAAELAALVEDVDRFRELQTRTRVRPARRERPPAEGIEQLRGKVRDAVERLKRTGQSEQAAPYERIPLEGLDRPLLERWYEEIQRLLGGPADAELERSIVATLEQWAGLPHYAESVRRLHTGGAAERSKGRSLVEDLVSRLGQTVPPPDRGPFGAEAEALAQAIRKALLEGGRMTRERNELGDDLSGYGYILVFHNARRAMDDLLAATTQDAKLANNRRRLMRRLAAWPRDAKQTWREALDLASKVDEDLTSRIQPPDLGISKPVA